MNDPLYPNMSASEEELELAHSDKAAGIFTEPSATFSAAAKFPPRTIDWLMPLFILIIVAALSTIILNSNPEIKRQIIDKQMEGTEKALAQMVEKGDMSEADAQTALDNQRQMMQQGGAFFTVIGIVSIVVISFIAFFIISGVIYLLSKLVLKGEGTYVSAMTATGLPYYIYALQAIVVIILSLAFSRWIIGTSVASLADMDKSTFMGFILGKIDVFTIWALAVTGIGVAKMFRIADTKKAVIMVFALWIGWSLIAFGLAKAVPFLSFLNM